MTKSRGLFLLTMQDKCTSMMESHIIVGADCQGANANNYPADQYARSCHGAIVNRKRAERYAEQARSYHNAKWAKGSLDQFI